MAKKSHKKLDPNLDFLRDHIAEETTQGGASKVGRYGWRENIGEIPPYRLIHKHDLVVDRRYQRPVNQEKVKAIAADFWWAAFGVAIVVDLGDGLYAVADAQHRVWAAIKRADVTMIPCVVVKCSSSSEAAEVFLRVNTFRKALSALDRFNPQVETGDKAAIALRDLIDSSDRVLGGNGNKSIRCVGTLKKLAEVNAKRLAKIWPLLLDLSIDSPMVDSLVRALFYLEGHVEGSITDPRWRDRLLAIGQQALVEGARRQASVDNKGGERVWAEGILRVVNKGLHNKLNLKTEAAA